MSGTEVLVIIGGATVLFFGMSAIFVELIEALFKLVAFGVIVLVIVFLVTLATRAA